MNLRDLIEDRKAYSPDKVFMYYKEEGITYDEMDRYSNRMANALLSEGINKGDKVAIMLPNCPEFIYAWFGMAKIGAVEVLVNTQLSGSFLKHQIEIGECSAAVVSTSYLNSFLPILPELPALKTIIYLPGVIPYGPPEGDNYYLFWDLLNLHPDDPPPESDIKPWDPLSIMFTSGTTGPSKAVLNCHKAYIRCGEDCARLVGLSNKDRCYCVLPLYHGNPQMMAVMSALWIGGSLVLRERFSASNFFRDARQYSTTYFTYVGTVLSILSKLPVEADEGDNPLKLGFGGGAPKEVWRAIEDRFKMTIYEAYGMIEAGCVTTINGAVSHKFGSIGIPRDCFEVRVVDPTDNELPTGEAGEIVVRPRETFVMFDGYYNTPEETLVSLRNLWFHTGDRARKDEDGFFYFEGRVKHTIRRKGENISSEAIENVINSHAKVFESAVVGVPDEIAEEEIKAYVIPKLGENLAPEEIIEWCRYGLPEFMIPRYIEFRTSFEKTGSEKIQKYKLQEEGIGGAWDRMAQNK